VAERLRVVLRHNVGSGRRAYRKRKMTHAEWKGDFEKTGWAIREVSSGEVVGEAGRYAIRTDEKVLGDETVFELRDEELDMKAYARRVPTPERAAELARQVRGAGGNLGSDSWQGADCAPGGSRGPIMRLSAGSRRLMPPYSLIYAEEGVLGSSHDSYLILI
jgi:hypothetical protein